MGIDYGTKKVGIALSDEGGRMAFPKEVIPNDHTLLAAVEAYIKNNGVGAVVVGYSLNREGEENKVQEAINEFIGDLTLAAGVPIHLQPERYSTKEALQIQGKTAKTDASAAALILDSYLTKHRK